MIHNLFYSIYRISRFSQELLRDQGMNSLLALNSDWILNRSELFL